MAYVRKEGRRAWLASLLLSFNPGCFGCHQSSSHSCSHPVCFKDAPGGGLSEQLDPHRQELPIPGVRS